MRHVGRVSIGSYEHISDMVMVGHMSNEVIRAFILLKALMPLVFIRTFPSSYLIISHTFYQRSGKLVNKGWPASSRSLFISYAG